MVELENLSNLEVSEKLVALCKKERLLTVQVLFYLNEVERRKLHLEEGYPSLFALCMGKLGYSEGAASKRISSARCLREYPVVVEWLQSGKLSLSTLSRVAKHLSEGNHLEVLKAVAGKSRVEVEMFLAGISAPKAQARESMKPVVVAVNAKEVPLLNMTNSFCNRRRLSEKSLRTSL